jgi:molybdate transport system ATP-binding protein
VHLRHRIGTLGLEVQFELTRPWTVLFGPSGSGKSTILRVIAGLLPPAFGRIVLGATTLLDTEAGVNVDPHLRGTPVAPQSPSLFPHLTVGQNLEFGGGFDPRLAAVFGIDGLMSKRPAQLSGGEAQRVNLARAVAARPRLLLLDEPFTGLDLPLRSGLIEHLLGWQQKTGLPILSVTHDVAEVFQLGAEVIQLRDGRVAAQGPVAEVLAADRERLLEDLAR